MHHLADSMTKLCHSVGSITMLVSRAFKCTIVLGKKLYIRIVISRRGYLSMSEGGCRMFALDRELIQKVMAVSSAKI